MMLGLFGQGHKQTQNMYQSYPEGFGSFDFGRLRGIRYANCVLSSFSFRVIDEDSDWERRSTRSRTIKVGK